jgi:hypothetical protein
MASPKQLAILKEGVEAWNQWRKAHSKVRLNLWDADLSGLDLRMANFSCADLAASDFSRTDLSSANLAGAILSDTSIDAEDVTIVAELCGTKLRGANLTSASLNSVDLMGSDLSNTIFHNADLSYANLTQANLTRADLTNANLTGVKVTDADLRWCITDHTAFVNVDLSGVKGLETIEHRGPSYIGIDTIYKSKGKIPRVFLRGTGIPENFIEYMASLVGAGIEFYSLFISYSSGDQEFAARLHEDLQNKGVRCWFAPHDIRSGLKIDEQIDEAIRVHDKVLLILSPASMASKWVKWEISNARKLEVTNNRRVLFPIRLCSYEAQHDWECVDTDTGEDLADEIGGYFIPDFSNWKDHDAYKNAFDMLLADLHGKPEPLSA